MGSDRAKLIARCCYAAVTIITLSVMIWIAWCLFGLTAVQMTEAQRRALVSYTAAKPLPSPTTAGRATTVASEETSSNAISKLLSATPQPKRIKDQPKGDFSARDRSANATDAKDALTHASAQSEPDSSVSSEDVDRIYARRVPPPGLENRPEEKDGSVRKEPSDPRPDIVPTKSYGTDASSESISRRTELGDADTGRADSRSREKVEVPRRDEIQSSRRSEPESVYREPEFDKEPSRTRTRTPISDRERSSYDDLDDDRGSRRRYDSKDRGRDTDDRYSKGDTRVYPNYRDPPLKTDDRFRDRERDKYPEDIGRKGDDDRYDDRYRGRDDRLRPEDRDSPRYKDLDDRPPLRKDLYKDEDRYRTRTEDRYRDREDEKYRPRDEERYRSRDDERYRYRSKDDDRFKDLDDDKYRRRDDDRYKDQEDDRIRSRDDERYRLRDDDRYRPRGDERYRSRDDGRYRSPDDDKFRYRDDDKRYEDDERYRTDSADRRVSSSKLSSRHEYSVRSEGSTADVDSPSRDSSRSYASSSRLSRPSYDDEDRYRERSRDDEYRRPSRYETDRTEVSPTRTRTDYLPSRPPRDFIDDSKHLNNPRERIEDDDRYDKDRIRSTRVQDSRRSALVSETSRKYADDEDRFRTRLPSERTDDLSIKDRREEVTLDKRSYATEDEEYVRRNPDRDDEERKRRPNDDTRRRDKDDEYYSRRDPISEDEYKSRRTLDRDRDSRKRPDRYDDDYHRYDGRYDSRSDDRYIPRDDRSSSVPVRKYDDSAEVDERPRRRDSSHSDTRPEDRRDREESRRSASSTRKEDRLYDRDERIESRPPSRRRFDDDDDRDRSEDPRYSEVPRRPTNPKEPLLGSSMTTTYSREPSDVIVREKRFQSTQTRYPHDRIQGDDSYEKSSHRDSYSSKSEEQVRSPSYIDVIEAANRHSDATDHNSRKVYYPVFDPRLSNLTSPEIIRPDERRGTTITARRRRFA